MKLIPLTKGLFAKVSDIDYRSISAFRWHAVKSKNTYYAHRSVRLAGQKVKISMHRMIKGNPVSLQVDHIDGNGLNNCRSNLRNCTRAQNQCNRKVKHNSPSQYLGVSKAKNNKWRARLTKDRKEYHLGEFSTQEEAALCYNNAAIKHHGKFARLNILSF